MKKDKQLEWLEAQKLVISNDLVAAAKQLLKFLAAVDRNRDLYGGPALDRAILRYVPHFISCLLLLVSFNILLLKEAYYLRTHIHHFVLYF